MQAKSIAFGREIGKVLVDGIDGNLEQITTGVACHYKAYKREQSPNDRLAHAPAEKDAAVAVPIKRNEIDATLFLVLSLLKPMRGAI
jgi:hypothetical protein